MTIEPRMQAKIRKLLALAADPSAAPNEAETAGRQAAKLMALHEVSLADLTEAELKAQWDLTSLAAQGCRPGKSDAKAVPPWIGVIAWGVKTYTRTRCTAGRGLVYFKGPRDDAELAKWLHELLLDGCYRGSKGLGQGEANAYRNGYAAAIQARLKKMADDRDQSDDEDMASSTGHSLVVVQEARQKAMVEAYGEEPGGRKSKTRSSNEGYAAGQAAHIPTARPLASTGRALLT